MKSTFLFILFIVIIFLFLWAPAPMSFVHRVNAESIGVSPMSNNNNGFWSDSDINAPQEFEAVARILEEGEGIIYGLIGLGVLSSIAAFAVQSFKLGKSSDPRSRSEAINNLIIIAITTVGLGGFAIIYNVVISIMLT